MSDKKISALTSATTPLAGTEVLPIVQSGNTVKVANNDLRPKQVQSNATSGVMQIVGPTAASTRVMTIPDANFTAARTDAGQTFTGAQIINGAYDSNNPSTSSTPILKVNEGGALSIWFSAKAYNYTWIQAIQDDGSNNLKPLYLQPLGSDIYTGANLVPQVAGQGINFTANTPAAGMTSQLLNWYEEGTWTPVVSGTWSTTPTIYGTARYTRIGRQVTLTFAFLDGALATNTDGYFTGLPFTPADVGTGAVVDNNIVNRGLCEATGAGRIWVTNTSFPDVNYISITYFV